MYDFKTSKSHLSPPLVLCKVRGIDTQSANPSGCTWQRPFYVKAQKVGLPLLRILGDLLHELALARIWVFGPLVMLEARI